MLTKSIVSKVLSFKSIGKWVFWNPCFTIDCRDTYRVGQNNDTEIHFGPPCFLLNYLPSYILGFVR